MSPQGRAEPAAVVPPCSWEPHGDRATSVGWRGVAAAAGREALKVAAGVGEGAVSGHADCSSSWVGVWGLYSAPVPELVGPRAEKQECGARAGRGSGAGLAPLLPAGTAWPSSTEPCQPIPHVPTALLWAPPVLAPEHCMDLTLLPSCHCTLHACLLPLAICLPQPFAHHFHCSLPPPCWLLQHHMVPGCKAGP